MRNRVLLTILLLSIGVLHAQPKDSPTWRDFTSKRTSGNWGVNTLTDFSYAGYKFSNSNTPNTSGWNVVRVRDHGARPDDGQEDNTGIQNAINAAQNSNRPTVVLFESGRYVINQNRVKTIIISKSNIVLKGTGSASGGTEIFCRKDWTPEGNPNGNPADGDWAFYFRSSGNTPKLTTITQEVKRGSFVIEVASSANIRVGQSIIIKQETPSNRAPNGVTYANTSFTSQWTRINSKGLATREIHVVKSKSGNRITLENPVLLNLPRTSNTDVLELKSIDNIGVESIRFTGNWPSYGETFIHHKPNDHTHDQGWSGLLFERVTNSWVKNCEFKDWNEAVEFSNAAFMTISNCKVSGKRAHASFAAKQSTGLLFKDITDTQNSIHGPGWQISTCGIVCTSYKLSKDQSMDLHGANPYANLFDDMSGMFDQNGSSVSNYPNAGPYNTFWNFVHDSNDGAKTLDFWSLSSRKLWTFADPIFVGLTSAKTRPTLRNAGKNESPGSKVYPSSIFDAQLQLRKFGGYMSASNSRSDRPAVRANDSSVNTAWETDNRVANQWLMLDFGTPKTLDKIFVDERSSSIGNYKIQYWDNNRWNDLKSGTGIGSEKTITFPSTRLTVIRLLVETKKSGSSDGSIKINTFGRNAIVSNENKAPVVDLIKPVTNATYTLGDVIPLEATASDQDGTVDRVAFNQNDVLVSNDTESPYTKTFSPTAPGTYKISAVARDNDGAETESFVTITVVENTAPIGSFVEPFPRTVQEGYSVLKLEVEATDPEDDDVTLTLSIDGTEIRSESNPPYEWGHTGSPNPQETVGLSVGDHEIKVVIEDSKGLSTTLIKTITVLEEGRSIHSPIHDAYTEGQNGKNDDVLRVEQNNRITYLQFDLPEVPSDFEIKEATLQLTVGTDNGGGTIRVYNAQNSGWIEGEINTTNAPAKSQELSQLNGPFETGKTYNLDVLGYVTQNGKVTFILESNGTGADDVSFASKENTSYAKPVLNIKLDRITSVELIESESFYLFPNPSKDGLFNLSKEVEWEVTDIKGQQLISGLSSEVNLTNYPKGVYLLRHHGQVVKLMKE